MFLSSQDVQHNIDKRPIKLDMVSLHQPSSRPYQSYFLPIPSIRPDYPTTSLAIRKCRTRWGERSTPIRILVQTRKRHSSLSNEVHPNAYLATTTINIGYHRLSRDTCFLSQILLLSIFEVHGYPSPTSPQRKRIF